MLNHIILIGRLTRDPDLRYTAEGTPVCNFTLAVERNYVSKATGKKDVDFIDTKTWRKLAENCAEHLGKGRLVAVEGPLHIRKSEKDGRTYINPEVVANEVRFLDWPKDSNKSSSSGSNHNIDNKFDDDYNVPF